MLLALVQVNKGESARITSGLMVLVQLASISIMVVMCILLLFGCVTSMLLSFSSLLSFSTLSPHSNFNIGTKYIFKFTRKSDVAADPEDL